MCVQMSGGKLAFEKFCRCNHSSSSLPTPRHLPCLQLLMGFCVLLIPLLMKGFVETAVLGGFMTYMSCTCFFVLYEACRELEDPFLYEPNELPLLKWQSQFNEMLVGTCDLM